MSSIVNVAVTSAPRTGFPALLIATEMVFGAAARFGSTRKSSRYVPRSTVFATGPGPTWALAAPTPASAFRGGGSRGAAREEPRQEGDARGAGDAQGGGGQPPRRGETAREGDRRDEPADPDRARHQMQPVEPDRDAARRRLSRVPGNSWDDE